MNAPKKSYLQICGDCEENECQSCKFEDLEDNAMECSFAKGFLAGCIYMENKNK